jgi:hypothetical protein
MGEVLLSMYLRAIDRFHGRVRLSQFTKSVSRCLSACRRGYGQWSKAPTSPCPSPVICLR